MMGSHSQEDTMILHPSTAERHAHRQTQRKLAAVGFLPPAGAWRERICPGGHAFTPTDLVRWHISDRTLWLAACPTCKTSTSWEAS
jgi:hypothetical protein